MLIETNKDILIILIETNKDIPIETNIVLIQETKHYSQ